MNQGYTIPKRNNRHTSELTIARSRFITLVAFAESTDAAQAVIRQVRELHSTANHHVYAFRIGYGSSVTEGMSDDGEPSGTSGPPTLAVLRGSDLGDIVLVTTRYFGGTKLGTGGLVRAYTESAQQALASLPTEKRLPKTVARINMPYRHYESIRRILDHQSAEIDSETFLETVTLQFTIHTSAYEHLKALIMEQTAGSLEPETIKDVF